MRLIRFRKQRGSQSVTTSSLAVLDENPRNREAGQAVIIIMALCLAIFLGFAALATDVGTFFHAKRLIQTAADSAAVAGASELYYGDVTASAQGDAAKNGVTDGVNGASVVVNNPPLSGPYTGNSNYVEVIATESQPVFFMNVFGWSAVSVSARAVAHLADSSSQDCVYTLNSNISSAGITLSGSDKLKVPNCSIYDNASINMNGSTSITAMGVGEQGTGTGNITPAPTTGMVPGRRPAGVLADAFCSPHRMHSRRWNLAPTRTLLQDLCEARQCDTHRRWSLLRRRRRVRRLELRK